LREDYIKTLVKEIALSKEQKTVKSIYIGGGTPSTLSIKQIEEILKQINKNFKLNNNIEISMEVNPSKNIKKDYLRSLKEIGINRLSIGAQSLNNKILRFLGRIHSTDDVRCVLNYIREISFNFNVDLLYAVPLQTLELWMNTLKEILSFYPHHISAYLLSVEENTPFFKMKEDGKIKNLTEERVIEMYKQMVKMLKNKGYIHYEISNFSLPNFECIHNLSYWNSDEFMGFGVSASSFINHCRIKNETDIYKYMERIEHNEKPFIYVKRLSKGREIREAFILGLREIEGINIEKFNKKYKIDVKEFFNKALDKMIKNRLLVEENGFIHLSNIDAILISNEIFGSFVKKLK
jgi:oxygen-independent coproporphyrinogen-3 oxidase